MKKKALMAILPLCVAMAMTACGGNADTAEVKETTVAEETAEAEEQTESEETDEYYEAGRRSLYGLDGAQIDLEDAHTNFTKSQELGNADANFYLGVLADWYGYPKWDYEQARAYYEQSGDNPYAQIALGFLYYSGQGVEQDREKGKELFQSAADTGVVEGYYGLAVVAKNEEDIETALGHYNKVVEEGTEPLYIAYAMNNLGHMYRNGEGVEQDYAKAIEWYTKAADLGDADAMNNLGYMYEHGVGVEQDGAKAVEWYIKAADLGNTTAMNRLGYMYYNGEGVEQDYAKAIEWSTKAADSGDATAMNNLGYMYAKGNGVEQDNDKALEWYVKSLSSFPDYEVYKIIVEILHGEDAAEKWFEESGDVEKMMALAELYRSNYSDNGEQVLPDFDKAIEWYTKAADLGNSDAMKMIGQMYMLGSLYGREDDLEKAKEWYQKAADLGNTDAQSYLERLQGQ